MNKHNQKNKIFIMINMIIVFGWLLSFPFEGPVLYAMLRDTGNATLNMNRITVFFVFIGLFCGSFISKDVVSAKRIVFACTGATLVLSILLPFLNVKVWLYVIPIVALLAGVVIPTHGRLIKAYVASDLRIRTIADLLMGGNLILVIAHILANNIQPIVGFLFIEILLIIAFAAAWKIDLSIETVEQKVKEQKHFSTIKRYWMLLVFIFVITINSGIMFSVIYPYFSQFEMLMSIYTNIPYIITIYFISRFAKRNKFYLLYIGLASWGITFILFALIGQTAVGFVIICTIMLFAVGIFDMFWASIMVDNFDHVNNPSSLYGLGLAINVFGVWVGGMVGSSLLSIGMEKYMISFIGIFIVIISMLIILPLNKHLANQLDYNEFILKLDHAKNTDIGDYLKEAEAVLTKRELDVFSLLISGKTDAQISAELYITLHTIKTHNRSIYKKYHVANRVELIEKIISYGK